MVHDQVSRFFNGFRRDAHPMAIMVGVVGALSAFYHNQLNIEDVNHREITAIRLIAKFRRLQHGATSIRWVNLSSTLAMTWAMQKTSCI